MRQREIITRGQAEIARETCRPSMRPILIGEPVPTRIKSGAGFRPNRRQSQAPPPTNPGAHRGAILSKALHGARAALVPEANMRTLALVLSSAALITLAATPAPAASRTYVRHHHGYYAHSGYRPLNAGGVYSPGPIYRQGRYLGTDPDPNVRSEIIRDPYFGRK